MMEWTTSLDFKLQVRETVENQDRISAFLRQDNDVSLIQGNLLEHEIETIVLDTISIFHADEEDVLVEATLDSESLVSIFRFCGTVPLGERKVIFINLTDAPVKAQTSLLKLLEVQFERIMFVLFSHKSPIPTLMSRCAVYRLAPLSERLANRKTKVLKALASTALKDQQMLENTMSSWDEDDTSVLHVWACERLSYYYELFSKDEVLGLGFKDQFALNLLEALGTLLGADSRRAVRSILISHIVGA